MKSIVDDNNLSFDEIEMMVSDMMYGHKMEAYVWIMVFKRFWLSLIVLSGNGFIYYQGDDTFNNINYVKGTKPH